MVEPGEGAELLLSLVRAMAPALRPCSAPPRQSGSANWANKADIGLVVHRDPNRDPTRADIFVRKSSVQAGGQDRDHLAQVRPSDGALRRIIRWMSVDHHCPCTYSSMSSRPKR